MILTRCPACQTVFRVRPEQLRARHGEVRCGHCLSAFNALDHLVDESQAGGETPRIARAETPSRPETPPHAETPPQPEEGPSGPAARPTDVVFVLEEKEALPAPQDARDDALAPGTADVEPTFVLGDVPSAGPERQKEGESPETPRVVGTREWENTAKDWTPFPGSTPNAEPASADAPPSLAAQVRDQPRPEEHEHKASTFESLADRLEFEVPESFLTPSTPPADTAQADHVRFRQRKTEWPEIPRPATPAFPDFVPPSEREPRFQRAGEKSTAPPPPSSERSPDATAVPAREASAAPSREASRAPARETSAPAARETSTPMGQAFSGPPAKESPAASAGKTPARPAETTGAGPARETGADPSAKDVADRPSPPKAPPVSRKAVEDALRQAAAEAPSEPIPEPPAGEAAPHIDDESDEADRLNERYGSLDRPRRRRWPWAVGLGILLGILWVQVAYLFRDEITRTWPQLRPVYLVVCEYLGCTLELSRIAGAIHIETSDLLSDPKVRGSFTLNAVVRNNAPYPQAFPYLELTLTDARDRPVVRRALSPDEWVPAEKLERGFLAGEEIAVHLPFQAPEVEAVGYRIYAFYP